MKKIFFSISIIGVIFSGCTNQPQFNPNKKIIKFVNGKPYSVPQGSISTRKSFSRNDEIIFNLYGIENCKENAIAWFKTDPLKMKFKSTFKFILNLVESHKYDNATISDLIQLLDKYKNNLNPKESKFIIDTILQMSNKNTTMKEISQNRHIINFLAIGGLISAYSNSFHNYNGTCIDPMSKQEYGFQLGNQRQEAQFQHENDIQSQKSIDKSLDRLNDTINSMTPKTYNINHSGSINLYHY